MATKLVKTSALEFITVMAMPLPQYNFERIYYFTKFLPTKITIAQNEVKLRFRNHRIRRLYFLADIFVATILYFLFSVYLLLV